MPGYRMVLPIMKGDGKRHLIIALSLLCSLAIIALVAAPYAFGTLSPKQGADTSNGLQLLRDRNIQLLGDQKDADLILAHVNAETVNITVSTDFQMLMERGSMDVLLLDGQFISDPANASAVGYVQERILSGIPVIIVDGPLDLLTNALAGQSQIGNMYSSGGPTAMHSYGTYFDPQNGTAQGYEFSSVSDDQDAAWTDAIEWCAGLRH